MILLLISSNLTLAREQVTVFVSILPQAYFVERIGGDLVEVHVLVKPGHSPATYDLTISQLQTLRDGDLYFKIGVPFEEAWLERIKAAAPAMEVVDLRANIELRNIDGSISEDAQGRKDPHIWLDPLLVIKQAATITQSLIAFDPTHQDFFQQNLEEFTKDLESLDQELREILQDLEQRNLMVFHPAWGYFAQRYHLTQIPIEVDGNEPSPRQLAEIIDFGLAHQIDVIFVQQQFSQQGAKNVAQGIGAKVISINPLAEDYLNNLRQIATVMAGELK